MGKERSWSTSARDVDKGHRPLSTSNLSIHDAENRPERKVDWALLPRPLKARRREVVRRVRPVTPKSRSLWGKPGRQPPHRSLSIEYSRTHPPHEFGLDDLTSNRLPAVCPMACVLRVGCQRAKLMQETRSSGRVGDTIWSGVILNSRTCSLGCVQDTLTRVNLTCLLRQSRKAHSCLRILRVSRLDSLAIATALLHPAGNALFSIITRGPTPAV